MPNSKHRPDTDPHSTQAPQDAVRGPHERDRNAHTDPREQDQRIRDQPANRKSRGRGTRQR